MKLVFWFDNPPRVSKGAFNEVSRLWNDEVFYCCTNETREERKRLNWDEGGYGKATLKILSHCTDDEVLRFIRELKDEIHIFCGYKGSCSKYLKTLLRINHNPYLIIWAERPGVYGKKAELKKVFLPMYHSIYAMRLRKKTDAFLPLGKAGIEQYQRFGWRRAQLFEYAYIPPTLPEPAYKKTTDKTCVKTVYLGRFSSSTKGTDVLMRAVDMLKNDNFVLDMVGGYGDLKEAVEKWANNKKNVNVTGSWPINEARERLAKYDLCIVPSRFDGWNVTINESLLAHTGVITTDAAGSDELVSNSGAGMVVPANDANALADAIKKVLDDPRMAEKWSKKAEEYCSKILPEAAAQYFIQVINYAVLGETTERPVPPWIK